MRVTTQGHPAQRHPLFGVALYAVALLLFAGLDTLTKVLTTNHHYPVPLVAWVRYLVQLLLLTGTLVITTGRPTATPVRRFPAALRSVFLVACTLLMGLALRRLPLAEAAAIVFTAPLLVVLLSGPLLGERLTVGKVAFALLGFCGVVLIARPTGQLDALGVLFALLCAGTTAAYQLMSRTLSHEQPLTLLYNSSLVGAIAFALLLPFSWGGPAPTAPVILMFLGLGLTAGLGHFLLTLSFRYAPASLISPVTYLQLLWAGLLGWLVFRHVPDPVALIGMAIVAASGIATVVIGRRVPRPSPEV